MPERKKKGERNVKLSVTIEPKQGEWVKKKLVEHKYYNKSHIVQEAIRALQEKEKNS